MTLPHIGITTGFENDRQSVDHHYIRAVEAAGGLPIIMPMLASAEAACALTALLDGLIITGGPAITHNLVGSLPADLPPTDPVRAASDTLLFNAAQTQPILGICYGMQFINAQAGGSIYADVSAQQPGAAVHSAARGGAPHPVMLAADSRLRAMVGAESLTVNTFHIQAVSQVGAGLRAVGYSPDGVIEALESADGRMIGVQFHPERMLETTLPLFMAFVEACRRTTEHKRLPARKDELNKAGV